MGYYFRPRNQATTGAPPKEKGLAVQATHGLGNFLKELGIGTATSAAGTTGDILNLVPSADMSERYAKEHATPLEQLQFLSDESELPYEFNLSGVPTTHGIERALEVGEPEGAGKLGRRFGHTLGPMLLGRLLAGVPGYASAVPSLLKQSAAASTSGQLAEELGFGPVVQAIAEIAGGSTVNKLTGTKAITSKNPAVQQELQELERMGMSEQGRYLARQGAEQKTGLAKASGATPKAREALKKAQEELHDFFRKQQTNKIPGLKEGRKEWERLAGEHMQSVEATLDKLPFRNRHKVSEALNDIASDVTSAAGLNEPQKESLNYIQSILHDVENGVTPLGKPLTSGDMLRTVRNLNDRYSSGMSNVKKGTFKKLKEAIYEGIGEQGPEGKAAERLARESTDFWRKHAGQREALDILEKAVDNEGVVKWKTVKDAINNPDKRAIIAEALEPASIKDLSRLVRASEHIDEIQKALESSKVVSFLEKGSLYGIAGAIFSAVSGAVSPALAATASVPYAALQLERNLATKMLTDPRYQNMAANFLEGVRQKSFRQMSTWGHKIQEALEEDEKAEKTKTQPTQPKKGKYKLRRAQ